MEELKPIKIVAYYAQLAQYDLSYEFFMQIVGPHKMARHTYETVRISAQAVMVDPNMVLEMIKGAARKRWIQTVTSNMEMESSRSEELMKAYEQMVNIGEVEIIECDLMVPKDRALPAAAFYGPRDGAYAPPHQVDLVQQDGPQEPLLPEDNLLPRDIE